MAHHVQIVYYFISFYLLSLKTWGGITRYGHDGNELGVSFGKQDLTMGCCPKFVRNNNSKGSCPSTIGQGCYSIKEPPVG